MHTASICANSCTAVSDMSCNSLYGLLTQFIISLFSSMTKVCLQTTTPLSFLPWNVLFYIVYRPLVVWIIGSMSETEILSCYAAMESLLWYEIISNQSHLERSVIGTQCRVVYMDIIIWKLAHVWYIFILLC